MELKKIDQFQYKNNNWKKVTWLKIIQSNNKIHNLLKIMEIHTHKDLIIRWSTTQPNTLQLLDQGKDKDRDLLTIIEVKSIYRQMILKISELKNGKNQKLLVFRSKIITVISYKTVVIISQPWPKCLHQIISNQTDQFKITITETNILRLKIVTEESTLKIQNKSLEILTEFNKKSRTY